MRDMMSVLALVGALLSVSISASSASEVTPATGQVAKSTGPPAFFLQDPNDGLCLSGSTYKRCAIDTLWYVSGKPGSYQIHHRLISDDDDESCLDRADCHLDESAVQLANCGHCGAKKWNILGDTQTGYVLTEDKNKNCLKRVGETATMIRCDQGYSGVSLQFASKDDIAIMSSEGARLINAATDNDMGAVKGFLKNDVDVNARDWDNITALMASAGKGHFEMVKHLVAQGADVDMLDKDNITALTEAVMGGHLNIIEFLANSGASVDPIAASGVSPLWLASGEGYLEIVNFLLARKANPDNARSDGITALMAASSSGHVELVRSLLTNGASANGRDKEGLTALLSASENGSEAIVQLLLDHGADMNSMSENGYSPLIVACAHGNLEVVKLLLAAGAVMEMEHPDSVTPLMYAAAGGFPDVVALLIEKGATVNSRHKQGGTALIEAATVGNVTVTEILLAAGADPLIVDDDHVTALMSAASQGHTAICEILLNKKLEINAVAKSGGTALMFAAGGGHNETTKFLISKGADVNVVVQATPDYVEQVAKAIAEGKEDVEPHKDGVTALMVAAQGGHLSAVTMLVEAGAVVDIADDEDVTPLLNAIKGNFAAVSSYLVEHGANPNDVYVDDKSRQHNLLMDAILAPNPDFATLLISKGANLSYADKDGVTIVTQAAYQGLVPIVKSLLEKDVDINAANDEGINALIAAASEGHSEVVGLLIATGKADVNVKDKDGTNALMAAAVRGHKEVVDLLVQKGVDVNAQNVDGHTALMFAYNGKNQVETLLDKYGDYVKENSDNSTKIIQEALDTHIYVVNLLSKSGADMTIKDNEGHTAVDFDYKPPEISSGEGTITAGDEL